MLESSIHVWGYLEKFKHILPSKTFMLPVIHIDTSICLTSKQTLDAKKQLLLLAANALISLAFATFYSYGYKKMLENWKEKHLLVFIHCPLGLSQQHKMDCIVSAYIVCTVNWRHFVANGIAIG